MPGSATASVTLPTDEQILITRAFDAPKHLVYRAWTTPELVRRWWSGRRGEMTLVEMDFRVGGAWRYVMNARDGHEVGFHGEYREIVPDVHRADLAKHPQVLGDLRLGQSERVDEVVD